MGLEVAVLTGPVNVPDRKGDALTSNLLSNRVEVSERPPVPPHPPARAATRNKRQKPDQHGRIVAQESKYGQSERCTVLVMRPQEFQQVRSGDTLLRGVSASKSSCRAQDCCQ